MLKVYQNCTKNMSKLQLKYIKISIKQYKYIKTTMKNKLKLHKKIKL